jgi:flagellar hook-length control protein FliK
MNLSSYLQMPPAPLVPTNTSNTVPQGPRAGVSPSAGNNLGFDFADVMARQLQRLVPQQRQTIAADTPQEAQTVTDKQDSRPVVQDRRSADRPDQEARSTRADNDDSDQDNADHASTQARPRKQGNTHKADRTDVDALLEGLMQGAPITQAPITQTPVAAEVTTTATTTAAVSAVAATPQTSANADLTTSAASLQTVELSPQMRIITDPKAAPSPESLAAFAKSMGLDESAIQDLLAQQPVTPATMLASATNTGVIANGSPLVSANTLQAAMNTVLNGAAQGVVPTDSAVARQMAAMAATAEQPVVASGAGLAAPATTLAAPAVPGLTPTDMAAIQQLQITVLPAAVLPVNTQAVNTPVPSTVDMLALLGTGIDEKDVSALLSRFSEETSSDSNTDEPPSQGEGNNFSSFAQALSSNKNAANANPANAAQATSAHMSEVYDQLSDKMATEMAARMHKQLSDGEWKMKFALRPSNLGGVEIQLEMKDGKLDAVFRADNPLTRDLLQNSSQRLREALGNFGINAGQVNVGQGGGNAQQNNSGNAAKHSQVRDNSSSQVNGSGDASSATSARSKANASLLDLYA